MQHSKSVGSFASSGVDSDTENLLAPNRPRKRSSLDTFLIPRRIRIPSQKPEPFDVQVAETLLQSRMDTLPQNPPFYSEPNDHRSDRHCTSSAPSTNSECGHDVHYEGEPLYNLNSPTTRSPSSRKGSQQCLVIPQCRPHLDGSVTDFQAGNLQHHEIAKHQPSYDGPQDSSCESRVTSTTYSMVSRRIFSDSSSSSRGCTGSRFNEEYNQLAARHGLPETDLTKNFDEPMVSVEKKRRKHGWLKRKFFHHSTTNLQYKAKATYRLVPRKKSFSSLQSLTDDSRKNILDDKTLNETCRLGGLGVLILPSDFAAGKVTLPTCLAAAATYLLQYGVNAPGVFRVSGQTATVNALYEHFAHQFYHAGSPSKVQETVKPGLLPTDIEFTVSDVASLFKKIINGLEGGLLGSLELFEAIRASLFRLRPNPGSSATEMTHLRAKLIALAILSVTSAHRACLIQGALGLFAYFAHEAENARVTQDNDSSATDGSQKIRPSSELMGYQSLGVCLGPLLLGDLIGRVLVNGEVADSESRASTESTRKAKKKRISVAANRLEKDTNLAAHVDRANLTASIMQRLLMIWKDVVAQLHQIQGIQKASAKPTKESQVNKPTRKKGSRLTLRSSYEEKLFLDFLRGRTLPEGLPDGAVIREKIKLKRTSPGARIMIRALNDSPLDRTWFPAELESTNNMDHHEQAENKIKKSSRIQLVEQHVSDHGCSTPSRTTDDNIEARRKQSLSDVGMDRMTMGQILPPRRISRQSSRSSQHGRCTIPVQTPKRAKTRSSSDVTPQTIFRALPRSDRTSFSHTYSYSHSLDKPLPPLKGGLPPPPVPIFAKKESSFPTRQSSLALDRAATKQIGPPETLANSKAGEKAQPTGTNASTLDDPKGEGKSIYGERNEENAAVRKPLAETFSEREKAARKGRTKGSVTMIPAYINALPTAPSPLEDPFVTLDSFHTAKDPLISEPVNGLGGSRKAESRSPSPPKTPISHQRPFADSTTIDGDAETVRKNAADPSGSLSSIQRTEIGATTPISEVDPTRPLCAYTVDALHRVKSALDEQPAAQHITARIVSFESPSRPSSMLATSSPASLTTTIKRSGSNNATLYAEITRLKRQLEQKTEEIQATRRSLDAARATKEEGADEGNPKRCSWSKGTLSAEVREAKKEMQAWKRRAEWAEKRLAGLGALPGEMASVGY